jgi:hypothetical protein
MYLKTAYILLSDCLGYSGRGPHSSLFEYKPQNELISVDSCGPAGNVTSLPACSDASNCGGQNHSSLATLVLQYSKKELTSYTQFRAAGIIKASIRWMKRCSLTFWNVTRGIISKERCDALTEHLSERYTDVYAPRKVMNFATAFLKYLAKTHFDTRYQEFDLFLEMPKGLKARKHVTSRIVTKEDVENVLHAIKTALENEEINQVIEKRRIDRQPFRRCLSQCANVHYTPNGSFDITTVF